MNTALDSVMLALRKGINSSHQVLDVASIELAVDELEVYPMTIEELKESGVAQMLQAVRHQLSNRLQKRIRFVIKAWQKLIVPGSVGATVIPAQLKHSANGDNSRITSSVNGFPKLTPVDSTNSSLIQNPNGGVKPQLKQLSWDALSVNNVTHHDSPTPNPSKRVKTSDSFTSDPVLPLRPPSISNGRSPKPPCENGRVPPGSTAPKLSKVKSTAELIQEAGLFIDPATKDRILSNRIAKESDELVHVAPLAAMRSSRRSRAQRQLEKQQQPPQPQLKGRRKSIDHVLQPPLKPASVSVLPTLIEESSSFKHSTRPPIPPIKLDRIHSLIKQDSSPSVSSDHNHRDHHNHHRKEKMENFEPDEYDGDEKWKVEEGDKMPLPNHMDSMPALPPLTDEMRHLQQVDALVSYNSGRTPNATDLADLGKVFGLIQGSWEEVSASRDEEGGLHPMTEMYSVPLNQEDWMHILPWINMDGYRQTFFPPGFNTSRDIDRLIDLPEPW